MARWRIGVDVGGTFTDVAVLNADTGDVLVDKVPTTPANPALGIIVGLDRRLSEGVEPAAITSFLHGTTITTNALLEMKGVPVGLLLTAGLRGIAEVQSGLRDGPLTDLMYERPRPLAPPELTFEIPGRIGARGEVVQSLDESAVREAARVLRARGIRSIAVCYLFGYANPHHERRTRDILLAELPDAFVSIASEILPRIREWPRMSATLLNAYLEPLLVRYIDSLTDQLRAHGVTAEQLFLMQSNGGIMPFSAVLVGGKAIHTLLSGPAAGVQAGARFASLEGLGNLITMDVGGTSCDIAFIEHGRALEVTDGAVAGRDMSVPMLDVTAIGAGGGTLAWLDAAGALNVGPRSAGAEPGPVAYGRGGTIPTVTDANLVLGYLNPDYFLGGRLRLDLSAAEHAIDEHIARRLGLSPVDAAHAIVQIVNTRMADQIRVLASQRALLVQDFTLVAGGGAGAVHAAAVAEELGISRVLSPPNPGAFSALGLLCTNVIHDYVQSDVRPLCSLAIEDIEARYAELEERGRAELRAEGFGDEATVHVTREADVRYQGQGFELRVPVDAGPLRPEEKDHIGALFHEQHERLRGHSAEEEPLELVSYRLRIEVEVPQYMPKRAPQAACCKAPTTACIGQRLAWFRRESTPRHTSIWRRDHLAHGNTLSGPAIVEQVDATTVVPPDWAATIDSYGNLLLERP
jgi:N-methylhydantoinase A